MPLKTDLPMSLIHFFQVKFTIKNINFTREFDDFYSKHFDDMKRMVERELFEVLRANASFVMGIKLVRFENMTDFAEANFIVVMNETAFERNSTMFDLRNSIANGTFTSLVIHQDFPVKVQCKYAFIPLENWFQVIFKYSLQPKPLVT